MYSVTCCWQHVTTGGFPGTCRGGRREGGRGGRQELFSNSISQGFMFILHLATMSPGGAEQWMGLLQCSHSYRGGGRGEGHPPQIPLHARREGTCLHGQPSTSTKHGFRVEFFRWEPSKSMVPGQKPWLPFKGHELPQVFPVQPREGSCSKAGCPA